MRAANAIYGVEEGRPFWKRRPLQVVLTLGMVLLLALVTLALVLTGSLAVAVGDAIGVGRNVVDAWNVAKWPVLLIVVMTMFACLYYVAPNVRQPRFRWITPGGILGVLLWVAASAGFGVYINNLGGYDRTYGTLASVIVFLVWLWIANVALLLGAEFDAELERERELAAGLPAEEQIQLPPREPAT
jgi:membrane protein